MATPSLVLSAKCGASQQQKEIQPGRQLQSHILMLEKMHSRIGVCAPVLAKHTLGVATHVLAFAAERHNENRALQDTAQAVGITLP